MKRILEKGPGKRSEADINFLASYLRYNDFFFNLAATKDNSTLDQCFRNMTIEVFKKDEFVFHFGQRGDKFYVILKGRVKVMIPNDLNSLKEELIFDNMQEMKILEIGNSFGELALFSNKPRTASILTCEECYLAILKKKDFKTILCILSFKI